MRWFLIMRDRIIIYEHCLNPLCLHWPKSSHVTWLHPLLLSMHIWLRNMDCVENVLWFCLIDRCNLLIKFVNSAELIYAEFTENNNVIPAKSWGLYGTPVLLLSRSADYFLLGSWVKFYTYRIFRMMKRMLCAMLRDRYPVYDRFHAFKFYIRCP